MNECATDHHTNALRLIATNKIFFPRRRARAITFDDGNLTASLQQRSPFIGDVVPICKSAAILNALRALLHLHSRPFLSRLSNVIHDAHPIFLIVDTRTSDIRGCTQSLSFSLTYLIHFLSSLSLSPLSLPFFLSIFLSHARTHTGTLAHTRTHTHTHTHTDISTFFYRSKQCSQEYEQTNVW